MSHAGSGEKIEKKYDASERIDFSDTGKMKRP